MNVERCPEEDAAIAFRRQGQNLQVRELAKQRIAEARSLAGLIQSDDQKVRLFFLDDSADVGFVLDFADDLDVGLLRNCRENKLAHEAGPIFHHDPNEFLHARLPSPLLAASDNEEIKERSSWIGAKKSPTDPPWAHPGDSSVPKKEQ